MPDYKKLYFSLYNDISHAIELLQQAQQKAEEEYLEQEQATLSLIKPPIPNQKNESAKKRTNRSC